MIKNTFFKKKKIYLNDICNLLNLKKYSSKNYLLNDIKDLNSANKDDLSFFYSLKYKNLAVNTKCKTIITLKKFQKYFPKDINLLFVDNVLLSIAKITLLFYPDSLNEGFDPSCSKPNLTKYKNIKFGKNVLIGNNVKIGKYSCLGNNTIIERNVIVGDNCIIGSNVIIKNTIIGNEVVIQDGAVIGKKGFGFFPDKIKNIRYPHVGMVIIGNNVEIGCNNTIDRGSLSNTVIGDNTFLDNQVHIAHNVKIGKNCIITAQVGFAGSAKLGNQVSIGGQAGISGHISIGNNVQIGGGSGVIKNVPDNTKVMGYPAKDIRSFLKQNK